MCQQTYLPHPPLHVPIRSAPDEQIIELFDISTGELLEELQETQALFHVYEGGVYLHEGQSYIVHYADLAVERKALLQKQNVNWITKQRDFTNVDGIHIRQSHPLKSGIDVHYGDVRVTRTVFGYHKYDPKKNLFLETVDVYASPIEKYSFGIWLDLPWVLIKRIEQDDRLNVEAGIHTCCHLLTHTFPLVIMCASCDLLTEHRSSLATRQRPKR